MNIIKKIVKVILALILLMIICIALYVGIEYGMYGRNSKDDITAGIAFLIAAGFSLGLFRSIKG